jgi:hypothetical protein
LTNSAKYGSTGITSIHSNGASTTCPVLLREPAVPCSSSQSAGGCPTRIAGRAPPCSTVLFDRTTSARRSNTVASDHGHYRDRLRIVPNAAIEHGSRNSLDSRLIKPFRPY